LRPDIHRYTPIAPGHGARNRTPGTSCGDSCIATRPGVIAGSVLVAALVAVRGADAAARRGETARERDRAAAEAQAARQVSSFLIETFRAADPERHHGQEMTVRQQLDDAAVRLDGGLTGEPAAKAQLEAAIGRHLLQPR
jgi:hypothetical protein